MACTDILQLNRTPMFSKVRAGLQQSKQKRTKNIIDVVDDTLLMWNEGESALLATNWRSAQVNGFDDVKYQTLTLTLTLNFEVERVLASKSCVSAALAGRRGVAIMELPTRFGKHNQFLNGEDEIVCRTTNLCARFFHNNPHLEVRQIRWHPASPTDSHLLILLSDNTIRVHDGTDLAFVWQVGPIPLKTDMNLNCSTLMALGESVVDFDFAPRVEYDVQENEEDILNLTASMRKTNLSTSTSFNDSLRFQRSLKSNTWTSANNINESTINSGPKTKRTGWPIVLLRENGNVYVMLTNFENRKYRLQGPLIFTPPASDNYGTESCSIIVMPSSPPTLIIAETNGRLHHALMIKLEEADDSLHEVDESLLMEPVQWMLHIFETVELELGLPKDLDTNNLMHCPIHLKRDIVSDMRYFAYHNTGFHAITLYYLAELERFVESDVKADLTLCSAPSSAEYILCTKVDSQQNKVNAVLGFAIHEMPPGVIALLGSGQAISFKLVLNPKLLVDTNSLSKDMNQKLKHIDATPSFVELIQIHLRRDTSQPIISIGRSTEEDKNTDLSTEEASECLKQAIAVLRDQYINRHDKVIEEFTKKIANIHMREKQQICEIEFLEKQIKQIRDKAHKMAEKFEEINERQEVFSKRCLNLVRESKTRLPEDSLAEADFVKEVERLNKTFKSMQHSLKTCWDTLNRQKYHVSKSRASNTKKPFELPPQHQKTILDILTTLGSEIQNEIGDMKMLTNAMGN